MDGYLDTGGGEADGLLGVVEGPAVVAEEEVDVGAVREEDGGVGGGPGVESGEGLHLGDGLGVAGDRLGVVLPAHPDELVALLLVLARRCLLDCGDAGQVGLLALGQGLGARLHQQRHGRRVEFSPCCGALRFSLCAAAVPTASRLLLNCFTDNAVI